MITDPWVIWSFEHNAWWKPDRRGYTPDLIFAGVYSKEEADEIERDANRYTPGNEVALPLMTAIVYSCGRSDAPAIRCRDRVSRHEESTITRRVAV